jgi:hypothetical protein
MVKLGFGQIALDDPTSREAQNGKSSGPDCQNLGAFTTSAKWFF